MIVACQWNMSSPTGPAEQLVGGSLLRSLSSFTQAVPHMLNIFRTTETPFGVKAPQKALTLKRLRLLFKTLGTYFVDAFKRHLCKGRGGFAPDVVASVPPNEASAAGCAQRYKTLRLRNAKEQPQFRKCPYRCPP